MSIHLTPNNAKFPYKFLLQFLPLTVMINGLLSLLVVQIIEPFIFSATFFKHVSLATFLLTLSSLSLSFVGFALYQRYPKKQPTNTNTTNTQYPPPLTKESTKSTGSSDQNFLIQELRTTIEKLQLEKVEQTLEKKKATQENQLKSEFLATTSQELQTPIHAILSFTDLLLSTQPSEEQQNQLMTIRDTGNTVLQMLGDMLDFSHLEIGKLHLDYKPFQLRKLIDEVIDSAQRSLRTQRISLHTRIDTPIRDHMMGDGLRLKQVLCNLIKHVLENIGSGSLTLEVKHVQQKNTQIDLSFLITHYRHAQYNALETSAEKILSTMQYDESEDTKEENDKDQLSINYLIIQGLIERMKGEFGERQQDNNTKSVWFNASFGVGLELSNPPFWRTESPVSVINYDPRQFAREEVTNFFDPKRKIQIHNIGTPEDLEHICRSQHVSRSANEKRLRFAFISATGLHKENRFTIVKNSLKSLGEYGYRLFILYSSWEQHAAQQLLDSVISEQNSVCRLVERPLRSSTVIDLLNKNSEPHNEYSKINNTLATQNQPLPSPKKTEREEKPSKSPQSATQVRPKVDNGDVIALIVDDNPANRKVAQGLLQSIGVNTITANSGAEALNLFDQRSFSFILMDLEMPAMDGVETTRRIREKEQDTSRTPIIALTAHTVNDKKPRLLLAGMDDFISKPIREADLENIIKRWHQDTENTHANSEASDTPTQEYTSSTSSPDAAKAEEATASSLQPESLRNIVSIEKSLSLTQGNSGLAADMISMLLESLPESKNTMNTALAARDYDTLQSTIHRLHGGCCYCGVPELLSICASVDKKLQAKNYSDIHDNVNEIIKAIDNLIQWGSLHDIPSLFETT